VAAISISVFAAVGAATLAGMIPAREEPLRVQAPAVEKPQSRPQHARSSGTPARPSPRR
jgi:hypothetical protein